MREKKENYPSINRNHGMLPRIILFFILIFYSSGNLTATPELSLFTGNRCSECHLSVTGGGARNEFGWQFGNDASTYRPSAFSLEDIYELCDKKDYSYLDGLFAFGTDFRLQTIRSHKTPDAVRRIIPMQAALYISSQPAEWILLDGQYNFGPKIFPGQKDWSASVLIKPADFLPMIKAGFFQPTLGIRECDMTQFDRRVASQDGTESLIAPNFAEAGVEMIYEGLDWITLSAGIFDSRSLGEVKVFGSIGNIVSIESNPTETVRLVLWPGQFADVPDGFYGASGMANGDFYLVNIFAYQSIIEEISIFGQFSFSDKEFVRETRNWTAGISWTPWTGVFIGIRAETAKTEISLGQGVNTEFDSYQAVLYANWLILPYIEFRPEYRYMNAYEYESTRWALQFHFYL